MFTDLNKHYYGKKEIFENKIKELEAQIEQRTQQENKEKELEEKLAQEQERVKAMQTHYYERKAGWEAKEKELTRQLDEEKQHRSSDNARRMRKVVGLEGEVKTLNAVEEKRVKVAEERYKQREKEKKAADSNPKRRCGP